MLASNARRYSQSLVRFVAPIGKTSQCSPSGLRLFSSANPKSSIEDRIRDLGYQLPQASTPAGSYISCVRSGNMIYTAGHLPFGENGNLITGKVGEEVTVEQASHAAEMITLGILSSLKNEVANLDRIKRIVKVTGFIAASDNFEKHPVVLNGCSNLLGEIFEEKGVHARSAVGVYTLPLNACVEIEAVVEIEG